MLKTRRWPFELRSRIARKNLKRTGLLNRAVLEQLERRELLSAYSVTSLADPGTLTSGTLRWAVQQANTHTGNDTISFASGLTGVITLTQGQLEISDSSGATTIAGPSAGSLSVNGNNADRVFQIDSGAIAAISGLTITGGNVSGSNANGGGIYSSGELTLTASNIASNTASDDGGGIFIWEGTLAVTNCAFSDNTAATGGAVKNYGGSQVTISNSTFSGDSAQNVNGGGGIYNAGSGQCTITNCTISNETSIGYGAGVTNHATLTILNSTFSNDTSSDGGGALDTIYLAAVNIDGCLFSNNSGSNGGAIISDSTMTITDSTFSANSGGGAIYLGSAGTCMLSDSTISGNMGYSNGGIDNSGATVTINNSIIINNTTTSSLFLTYGNIGGSVMGSNNLIGTGWSGGLTNGTNGNLVGVTNAMLGPLQDNGGTTQTMALLPNSPAINAGSNALAVDASDNPLTIDQRGAGFPRISAGTVDIGAYESGISAFTVNSLNDPATVTAGTLRWAVQQANANMGNDTITFAEGLTGPIILTQGQLELDNTSGTTIITGPGANVLSISGNNTSRVFQFDSGVTADISGLTITDGHAGASSPNGGGILNNGGTVTLNSCTISGDTAFTAGGGIQNYGTMNISNSTLSGNSAAYGGGITNGGNGVCSLTITNSTLSGNSADNGNYGAGGGIYNHTLAIVTITNSTLANNNVVGTNGGGGGGIYNNGPLTLNNSIVAENIIGASTPSDIQDTVTANGSYNLIGTGGAGGLVNGTNGNIVGVANALLGPLQNNGGPTWTMALQPGSPAIDAGGNSLIPNGISTDQRGLNRIFGTAVDVGAFELQNVAIYGHGNFAGGVNSIPIRWDPTTGNWYVTTAAHNEQVWGAWSTGVTWTNIQYADVNGDGKTDVIGRVASTGAWYAAISNGSSFTNVYLGSWTPSVTWNDVQVADINGDGKADIIYRVASSARGMRGSPPAAAPV